MHTLNYVLNMVYYSRPQGKIALSLQGRTIKYNPKATVSGMSGTGIIIQGGIVNCKIFQEKLLTSTEMIPNWYNAHLRHTRAWGKHMEKRGFEGL